MDVLSKYDSLKEKYDSLTTEISDPDIVNDYQKFQRVAKEHKRIEAIINKFDEFKAFLENIKEAKEMLKDDDPDIREMAKEELEGSDEKITALEQEIKIMLIPPDPNDERNTIMEIRAGTGGDEAALFTADLFRMYSHYAEKRGWTVEVINSSPIGVGGLKEVVFSISGDAVYSKLKYESGIHRVQRVPATESSGRIHTSAATVAVLPEVDEVHDVEIKPEEIQIDVFRASGAGGQHVNTTDSAVRLTHRPTGIVISCQDERSQLKNKDKAMKILAAKLYDLKLQEQQQKLARERKAQVGTGDRSGKIRTYNFPQGRVTDHRINLTLYKLAEILNGDMDEVADALTKQEQIEKLENLSI